MSVTVQGKTYQMSETRGWQMLDLSEAGITSIKEIEGLNKLANLENLDLSGNKIEVK